MKIILRKKDMDIILSNYNLGRLKKIGKIKKDDVVSLGQEIITTKGKYFLKVFKSFNIEEKQGFETAYKLQKNGFPTHKIFLTKNKDIFLNYKKYKIIILEFVGGLDHDWKILSLKEIRDYARTLAKFHKITKKTKLNKGRYGSYEDISKTINKYYNKRKKYSKKFQDILSFMKKEIDSLPKPKNQYITGYYSEYNPGHVKFRNNKVVCVYDWSIGRDEAFYDIGSSMPGCFEKGGKLSSKRINEFVKAYGKERPLTKWEKEHIFDALKFGILKHGIWGFFDLKTGTIHEHEKNFDKDDLNMVLWLMNVTKDKFKGLA